MTPEKREELKQRITYVIMNSRGIDMKWLEAEEIAEKILQEIEKEEGGIAPDVDLGNGLIGL